MQINIRFKILFQFQPTTFLRSISHVIKPCLLHGFFNSTQQKNKGFSETEISMFDRTKLVSIGNFFRPV
jgi:hypothetical protein